MFGRLELRPQGPAEQDLHDPLLVEAGDAVLAVHDALDDRARRGQAGAANRLIALGDRHLIEGDSPGPASRTAMASSKDEFSRST